MSNALSLRLKRLEKKAGLGDPLALLTDDELDRMIDAVQASIAETDGMAGGDSLAGAPNQDEMMQDDLRRLVASVVNNRKEIGATHGR